MMDVEYIKMCRSAEEIQEQWEPKSGDIIIRTHSIFGEEIDKQIWDDMGSIDLLIRPSTVGDGWWTGTNKDGDSICLKGDELYKRIYQWLPRQEDLQAIALNHESMKGFSSWWIMVHFMDFYEKSSLSVKLDLTSVWLAFVMETCYGKRWNSEKKCWVKV
jgi:hypothetical protein